MALPTEPEERPPIQPQRDNPALLHAREDAKQVRQGLAVGAVAVLLALAALPLAARFPFGVLALDVGMAWGLLSLLRLAWQRVGSASGEAWFVAMATFLPVPFLARFLAAQSGVALPPVLRFTWLFEVTVLGAVLWILVELHRGPESRWRAGARLLAVAGAGLSLALFALILQQLPLVPQSALAIWGVTLVAGASALFTQRVGARRLRGTRFEVFASASALFLAATQLLDGLVSYLSVRDPLGVLAANFSEQVAVSAWLIEITGPGYALAKWLLALGIVYAIDARTWPSRPEPTTRMAVYLFVALIGLGPGLFSATRLIA